jgi:uncharacterized integral membrane protein
MRKFLTALILVPLAIIIILFAVANREIITLSFDPFDSAQPAFALKAPLFVMFSGFVALGVLIGGLATWINQRKWRARARKAERAAVALREQLAAHKWPADSQRALPPGSEQASPFVYPPAA